MQPFSSLKFKISIILLLFLGIHVHAQVLSSRQIDSVVEKTLSTFNVPGIAVSVIKDGKVIHLKGYGVSSIKTNQKVDENTLFGVASNTKAFTAASLGMLVDENKITWDTKVTDIIPEFKIEAISPLTDFSFDFQDLDFKKTEKNNLTNYTR